METLNAKGTGRLLPWGSPRLGTPPSLGLQATPRAWGSESVMDTAGPRLGLVDSKAGLVPSWGAREWPDP